MTAFRVDPEQLEELAGESWRRRERLAEGCEALAKAARGVAGEMDWLARGGTPDDRSRARAEGMLRQWGR